MSTRVCKFKECEEEVWEKSKEGFCLFHDPQISKKDPEKVKNRIIKNDICNLTGFKLPGNMVFEDETFEKEFIFKDTSIDGVLKFFNCEFRELKIKNCTFSNSIYFKKKCKFRFNIWIDELEMKNPSFPSPTPSLSFHNPIIGGVFCCKNSTIGRLNIINAEIKNKFWFENVDFLGYVRIRSEGARWFTENVKFSNPETQKVECMRAKKVHEENGNQIAADKHFYLEMKGRRKQKFDLWGFFEWLIADLTCEYGTNWKRVLSVSGGLIILFGFIYWLGNRFAEGTISYANGDTISTSIMGLLDSFYYSIVTFTTLGQGNMYPTGILKFFSAIQSVFGAIFMALLIAVFARKWMRK